MMASKALVLSPHHQALLYTKEFGSLPVWHHLQQLFAREYMLSACD